MLNVNAHWRIVSRSDRSPFAAGEHSRPLRIVVDDLTVADDEALALMRSFSERPTVEIASTRPGASRRVVFGELNDYDLVPVEYILPDGGFNTAVFAGHSWKEWAERAAQEHQLSEKEAFRELVLAQFCARDDVDALITGSAVLQLPMWRKHAESANVQSATAAVALLGLHLRANRDFTVRVDGSSTFLREDQFYRGAAVAALTEYPAVLSCAEAIWRQQGDPAGYSLMRGLEVRLGRALRARDYFQVRIRSNRPDDTWDDALFFFEFLLLLLSGALDAAARFCHVAFGVDGRTFRVSWRNKDWRKQLLTKEAALASLLAADGRLVATATVIGLLRNYIHGEALSQEFHFGDNEGKPLTIDFQAGALAVAPEDGERLRLALAPLGSEEDWGIQDGHQGVVLVLPARFMERALRATISSISDLMKTIASPLCRARPADLPFDPAYWVPGHEYANELRLLAGLQPLGK